MKKKKEEKKLEIKHEIKEEIIKKNKTKNILEIKHEIKEEIKKVKKDNILNIDTTFRKQVNYLQQSLTCSMPLGYHQSSLAASN